VRQLRSPAIAAYAIKGANAGFSFLVTAMLARLTDAATVGVYALGVSTLTLLGLAGLRGLDQIGLRAVAGDLREGHRSRAHGTWRWSLRIVSLSGLLLGLFFGAAVWWLPVGDWLEVDRATLLVAAFGIAVFPLFRMGQAGIRAAGFPLLGQFNEALPSILLAAALAGVALMGEPLTAALALALFVAMKGVAALIGFLRVGWEARHWGPPEMPATRALVKAGFTVMAIAMMHQFTGWFLLASLAGKVGAAEAGAFRVAFQIVTLALIVSQTAETYVAPRYAGDLRIGRTDLAWRRHWRASVLMLLISTPIFVAAIGFPEPLLRLAFGPEFAMAADALRVMSIGPAVAVLAGPIGTLLVMAGHERTNLAIAIAGAVALVVLAWLLVPTMGIMGAAIAYSVTIAGRNLLSLWLARRLISRRAPTIGPGGP
jgi:O-antigen/teichoic acid export membrane protein